MRTAALQIAPDGDSGASEVVQWASFGSRQRP
jgi:hypothetical protein